MRAKRGVVAPPNVESGELPPKNFLKFDVENPATILKFPSGYDTRGYSLKIAAWRYYLHFTVFESSTSGMLSYGLLWMQRLRVCSSIVWIRHGN